MGVSDKIKASVINKLSDVKMIFTDEKFMVDSELFLQGPCKIKWNIFVQWFRSISRTFHFIVRWSFSVASIKVKTDWCKCDDGFIELPNNLWIGHIDENFEQQPKQSLAEKLDERYPSSTLLVFAEISPSFFIRTKYLMP